MQLPWLGLGLSTNLSSRGAPHPYRLLERAPGAFDFVEYSAPLDVEVARRDAGLFEAMWSRRAEIPALYHPVHLNLWGPEMERPEALAALKRHLEAVGSPWVSNDVGWWHAAGQMFPGYLYLAPPLTRAAAADCARHALHVQAALPVPLLLENPAIFSPRGPLHVLDFMAELHQRTNLGLLLDLGHLYSHQLARGLPADAGLDGFPLEQVYEVHLAGGVVTERGGRRFYADDHPQPIHEAVFALAERVLPRCPNLRALTYEGDGHPIPVAIDHLARLRRLLPDRSAVRVELGAPAAPPATQPATQPAVDAWPVYHLAFGRTIAEGLDADPVADRAEVDFRLAVLAERLDRSFPLTRALLAGTRADLLAFSASPELEASFQGRGRPLAEAFLRFARRRLLEAPDDALAAVFGLESFAFEVAQRPLVPRASAGLAPAVHVLRLPRDLFELTEARRALDRHLQGRARAAGVYEESGLAVLREVARRAPDRPWPVAVRARGAAVELAALEPEEEAALQHAAAGTLDAQLEASSELAEVVVLLRQRGWLGTVGASGA